MVCKQVAFLYWYESSSYVKFDVFMIVTLENKIDTVFRSIQFRAFSYIRRLFNGTNCMHTLYILHNNKYSK